MATLALTAAANTAVSSFALSATASAVTAAAAQTVATVAGNAIDNAVFASKLPSVEGPRLSDLAVQSSAYGQVIPTVYGTSRIAGNIIWAQPIKETATTSSASVGGKGGSPKQSQTTYS